MGQSGLFSLFCDFGGIHICARTHVRICARQKREHGNRHTISIDCSGLVVLSLFCRCSRSEQSARRWLVRLVGGIFWQADMRAALVLVLAWCGSGAKITGPSAIVFGFSGSSWSSCARSGRRVRMAEISRFCGARAVLLEGSCWKDARKALFPRRFPARVVSLAGFGRPPGGSIGPAPRCPPSAPNRSGPILYHAGALDWQDLEPHRAVRPRLTSRQDRHRAGEVPRRLERD